MPPRAMLTIRASDFHTFFAAAILTSKPLGQDPSLAALIVATRRNEVFGGRSSGVALRCVVGGLIFVFDYLR